MKLTREEMIDRMVDNDINSVHEHDHERHFLRAVLTGDGWVPYNQLTTAQVEREYATRDFPEGDYE